MGFKLLDGMTDFYFFIFIYLFYFGSLSDIATGQLAFQVVTLAQLCIFCQGTRVRNEVQQMIIKQNKGT